jgi:hypothetical protein
VSLQDLGNVGEFVAAIGVIASLVYLALQIRQNTASVRDSAHVNSGRAAFAFDALIAHDPEIAGLWFRGITGVSDLKPEEVVRFGALVHALLADNAMFFRLHRRGLVDDSEWNAWNETLMRYLAHPGFRAFARDSVGTVPREFGEYLESKLRFVQLGEPAA